MEENGGGGSTLLDPVVHEVLGEESPEVQSVFNDVMSELVDEVCLGMAFETHRAAKAGTLFLANTDPDCQKEFAIIQDRGLDVFGQVPMKKQLECVCPNCGRNLAASRFAPHLEKCMGMGRNSSRIASRRQEALLQSLTMGITSERRTRDRKKKLLRKAANSSNNGDRDGNIPSVASTGSQENSAPNYETMTQEERKAYLRQACGVISEHTKKMCTRSHRCPQHTDDQRTAVRIEILGDSTGSPIIETGVTGDEVHVDIDSYEDGDSQALRDTLQWEACSNPSPADSNSSNNSKKRKRPLGKKKKSKNLTKPGHSNIPNSTVVNSDNLYDFV
ncbi:ataxin-7-like protein 3 [Tubulanus polymorphus]|uniref:ataxin-7-like protein 3 n=1 Tax=Tubulanus polymorphus TaxID=672921 RepID=UPI003DA4EED7